MANIPTAVLVFVALVAVLAAYVFLSWAGKTTGPLDEALLLLSGAIAGLAAPRQIR